MRLYHWLTATLLLSVVAPAWAANPQISWVRTSQGDSRYTYRVELLRLALEKANLQFQTRYRLKVEPHIPNKRAIAMVRQGELDIVSLAYTPELATQLNPIPVPMLQGLLGYRVFLVNQDSPVTQKPPQSLEELKTYSAGLGKHWADTHIFKHHQLPYVGSTRYAPIFDMLARNRIDYFPRGISEIEGELATFSALYPRLTIEESTGLYYPFPVFAFVSQQAQKLAEHLKYGLETALNDGSMQALFNAHYADLLQELRIQSRKTFCLKNPQLHMPVQSLDTSWWWDSSIAPLCQ